MKCIFDIRERVSYPEGLKLQNFYHQQVLKNAIESACMILEHDPCISLGKNALSSYVLSSNRVPIYQSERGGQVTAHEPGQLVIYPILSLKKLHLGVRSYVTKLEQCTISSLEHFQIQAEVDATNPGVWINGTKKIAALGIRIKNGVSMHGIAINICNDLECFQNIIPCGLTDRSVTTLSLEVGRGVRTKEFQDIFIQNFVSVFGIEKP